jgi:endonuclease-3
MLSDENVKKVIKVLGKEFPNPEPPLNFKNAYEALVAVVLSAQCTDARVNKVTPTLFPMYNTPKKMLKLGPDALSKLIHSCGFFNQKTKSIIKFSEALIEEHGGKMPDTLEELVALPGVGRKSASVILAQVFNTPAFPVDTHILRVSNRLGLVDEKTPDKTDLALRERIPKNKWIPLHLQIIFHGRKTCNAKKPKCWECPVKDICEYKEKTVGP